MRLFSRVTIILLFLTILVATASAGQVTFSGDARVRYIVKNNYLFGNLDSSTNDYWTSRVRINVFAKAAGGAYAKGRLRMDVTKWGDPDPDKLPWVDIAYIGVPMGPTVLEAGNMKSNLTRFFQYDQSADQARLSWDMFESTWTAIYRILNEGAESEYAVDRNEDNDNVSYGLTAVKPFLSDWTAKGHLFYQDDQRNPYTSGTYVKPSDGFFWSVFLDGKIGEMKLETEVAFKAADVRQSRDNSGAIINQRNVSMGNGWGWYIEGGYPMGSFTPILNIGIAANGYDADNDFGWLMIGNSNNEPISVISQVGEAGDWYWIAPSLIYNPINKLSMRANFVYVDLNVGDQRDLEFQFARLYELSGELTYMISDGASFTWKLGLLKPEINGLIDGNPAKEDTAFGTYGRVQINF